MLDHRLSRVPRDDGFSNDDFKARFQRPLGAKTRSSSDCLKMGFLTKTCVSVASYPIPVTNNGTAPVSSKGYELLAREIYQQMLEKDRALNVVVQHNVQKQGRSTVHQIDVYWEFCFGGVTDKVAVQAPVSRNPR
jgi:hypothetical protein